MSKHNEHQNSRMDDFREDLAIDLYPEIEIYNRAFKGKFFETILLIFLLGLIFCLGGILTHHYTTGDWLIHTREYNANIAAQKAQNLQMELDNQSGGGYAQPPQGGSNNNNADQGRLQAFDNYSKMLTAFISPISGSFDAFVFTTVDPTGFSEIQLDNSVVQSNAINGDKKLKFGIDRYMFTSTKYSNLFMAMAGGILLLIVIIAGYQVLTTENNVDVLVVTIYRLRGLAATSLLLFGFAPLLLSLSVVATNLVNAQILGIGAGYCRSDSGASGTGYADCAIKNALTAISGGNLEAVSIDNWDLGGYFMRGWYIFSGYFSSLPQLILALVILGLLFVILIQFVIRFINLYFLFCVYPIVVVFWALPQTRSVCYSYVKQILTLLLHQPFFLLGFVVLSDLSAGLFAAGVDAKSTDLGARLFLYALFLFSLTTVPSMLAARLFGDVGFATDNAMISRQNNYPGKKLANQGRHRVNQAETSLHNNAYKPTKATGIKLAKASGQLAKSATIKVAKAPGKIINAIKSI